MDARNIAVFRPSSWERVYLQSRQCVSLKATHEANVKPCVISNELYWKECYFIALLIFRIGKLKTDHILAYMIQRVLHLQDFLTSFTTQCKTKTVDMIALLWSTTVKISSLSRMKPDSIPWVWIWPLNMQKICIEIYLVLTWNWIKSYGMVTAFLNQWPDKYLHI